MKPFFCIVCVLIAAGRVLADPYSSAIQQARRVANQETEANRRLMDNPQSTPAQYNSNQATNPVLQATLQNIENLQGDFATLARLTNSAAVTSEKQGLTNDLNTAALGTKPSAEAISKLADDLASVVVGNEKLRSQHIKLAQYIHASFNGSQLPTAQQQMVFTEVQKILVNGGAAPDDTTNVINDIKTIVSQTK